ncbi:MAG TPA: TolC family protein [Pirellulales bacterium]
MSGAVNLKPATLEPTDLGYPINLAAALRLADARPLVISAAQASAWVAEAELQHAKILWVPTFNAGGDYIRHDGYGPDFNLGINTAARPLAQSVNFMYGGVGLTGDVAMADAIFQPLAARQTLNAKRWGIQSAKNNALLITANAYFGVHQYRGQYAGATDVVQRGHKLVERIQFLSHDLVPKVEVDRALSMLADMEQKAAMARQEWRVSSANLTQVLRLDPRVIVDPQEHDHLQITLIEPNRPLDELIPIGLTNRPELASQQALVQSVAQRIRREKGRLLMPSLLLNGFQTPNELLEMGVQGFGHGNAMNLWGLRDDISPQLMWQYEGMGFGNMARIKEQRGNQSQQIIEVFRVQDGIAGDVTRAQARLQSAAVRVLQADRGLREAIITYDGNYQGLAQTKRFGNVLIQVYRPQEAVIALEHLYVAYDNYFATVADYNRAQFEIFHALGYPAREVAALRQAGEAMPVDVNRPTYLPPVGTGPPPATR